MIAHITAGKCENEYKKRAKTDKVNVRYAMAQEGYYPEFFIYDDDDLIRTVTVEAHPNYIHYLLNKPEYLDDVNYILSQQIKPQLDILKLHIQLKLKSLTHEPTLLEKNMTPLQLYRANSPLWALTLSTEDILDVWEAEHETKTSEEKLMQILEEKHNGIVK